MRCPARRITKRRPSRAPAWQSEKMSDDSDDFATLGVACFSSIEDCKKAWKRLVLAHHPDKLALAGPTTSEAIQAATERTKAVNDAFGRIKAGTPRVPARASAYPQHNQGYGENGTGNAGGFPSNGSASTAYWDEMKRQYDDEMFGRGRGFPKPKPPEQPSAAEQARRNYDEQWRREAEREAEFEERETPESAYTNFWSSQRGQQQQSRATNNQPFGGRAHSFANSGSNKKSNPWAPGRR